MSRWLKSVNNMLEKLDDQVQTGDAAAAITQRLMTGRRAGNDSDEYYSDEEEYDDNEEYSEDGEGEDGEETEEEEELEPEPTSQEGANIDESIMSSTLQEHQDTIESHPPTDPAPVQKTRTPAPLDAQEITEIAISKTATTTPDGTSSGKPRSRRPLPSPPPSKEKPPTSLPRPPPPNPPPATAAPAAAGELAKKRPPQPSSAPSSLSPTKQQPRSSPGTKSSSPSTTTTTNTTTKTDTTKQSLRQQNTQLAQDLQMAREELDAQHDELQRAAERMKQDRQLHKEEIADLLEEQEEELQQMQQDMQTQLRQQAARHEQELQELRNRLQQEEHKRLEEGGDWTKELEDTLERERNLLKELSEHKTRATTLEGQVNHLTSQQETLQKKVASLSSTAKEATRRERDAEDRLDGALQQHKRQLLQRQERETELERTIAELGAALSRAQQSQNAGPGAMAVPGGEATGEGSNYEAKYQAAAEDLETTKTQLSLSQQQCQALQKELQEISSERAVEASVARDRQQEYDQQTSDLNAQIMRLEATLREQQRDTSITPTEATSLDPASSSRIQKLTRELDQTRRQLSSTSEQLMRQKGLVDSSKTEIVTLKGRLESATLRAETAENSLASNATAHETRMYETRGGVAYGTARSRRRVRGGGRYSQLPSRTLLSALGMQVAHGSLAEQVAFTIDSLDTWMMETGNILRHEPLARLGFACYFAMVHLWCLGLVFFHAVQSEHADLGNIGHRGDAAIKP